VRTVHAGPIELRWDDDPAAPGLADFRATWRDVTLSVSQFSRKGWAWSITYDDDGLECVEVEGFDRAQTAADGLALFLRKVGAIEPEPKNQLPRRDCLVRYEGDEEFRAVEFTAYEDAADWHFADDVAQVDRARVAEWKPLESEDA
jgi:hypothetical protein